MSAVALAHTHRFDKPAQVKVRLSQYRRNNGVTTSSLSGFDVLKVRKCECGASVAVDIVERSRV